MQKERFDITDVRIRNCDQALRHSIMVDQYFLDWVEHVVLVTIR